jgi:nicotinamidase-related amidase
MWPRLHRLLDHLFTARGGVLILAVLLAFIALGLRRTAKGQFEYYVFDPMPTSVRNVLFHGDTFRINPEPVCFIRFSASPADIDQMVKSKGFKQVEDSFNATGPAWWDVSLLPNVRVFIRKHGPKRDSKLFFGKNRRWTEVLRIDSTGTNAYFLVWGI